MQGPEVNSKFSSKIVKGNPLYNSTKVTKPRYLIIPIMIESEFNSMYKRVFGSILISYIREAIIAVTENENGDIANFKGPL